MANPTPQGYLMINGAKYAVPRDQFDAFVRLQQPIESSQLDGTRVQPPLVAAQTAGFEDGEGLQTITSPATGYYAAAGMEPVVDTIPRQGHLRLKVGRQLVEEKLLTSAGGFVAMIVYKNELYAAPRSLAQLWKWDGTTWSNATGASLPVAAVPTSLCYDYEGDRILIGLSGSTQVDAWNGSAVSVATSFTGATATTVFGSVVTSYTATPVVKSRVWVAITANNLWTYGASDTPSTQIARAQTKRGEWKAGLVDGDTFWVWDVDTSSRQPRADLCSAPADASTALSYTGAYLNDNYPVSACGYRGDLYFGMAWGGAVVRYSGGKLEPILHVGSATPPATVPGDDAIYAMTVYQDNLYVAGYDSTNSRLWLRRWDGTSWHLVSYGGNAASTSVRSMAPFQQTLMLGDAEATDGRVYSLSKSSRLLAADLEFADATFGTTAVQKRFRRISVQHEALVSGQAVDLRYKLDGGSETTIGINRDGGSTETVFDLPDAARGSRLRAHAYLTNVAGSDLIVSGGSVVAIPAPPALERWEATLELSPDAENVTGDTTDAMTRFNTLNALRLTGQTFQVVDLYRDASGQPLRAMLACFDPQVPLQWQVFSMTGSWTLMLPIVLQQAGLPVNLLLNASFEQDALTTDPPTSWTKFGTGTSATVNAAVTPQDGSKLLRLVFNGAAANFGVSQSVSGLTAGRYYTVSAYIRRATSAGTVLFDVQEGGVTITGSAITALAAATDTAFARYSATFLLPTSSSGTVSVRLFGQGTPAGTVYFDAAQLEEGAPASTFAERGSGG